MVHRKTERLSREDWIRGALEILVTADVAAQTVFLRTLNKRFAFARWMFEQVGFSKTQAEARGRMMVVYMTGESTLIPDAPGKRKKLLKLKYEILTNS